MEVRRVGVIGGGLMGAGIAETAAGAGLEVVVCELDAAAAERARARLSSSIESGTRAGRRSAADGADLLARIEVRHEIAALAGADLVIEAVVEEAAAKTAALREAAEVVSEDALIASNTSSIPIAQLASALPGRHRVLGLHFFAPVPAMKLVEIVAALDTGEDALETARAFVERIGKRAIQTKDRSGFIVNMLLVPYLMAAVRMHEEGFASAEDIDEGMRLGCGHPMGPLALCDYIGLDVLYAVCDSLYEEFKQPEYAPPPLLKRMIASGRLGRKAGRGFYSYE